MATDSAPGMPGPPAVALDGAGQNPGLLPVITINVMYAEPSRIWQKTLRLPAGSTAGQALAASRFSEEHPDCPLDALVFGVFGQVCSAGHRLEDADRLEIYRA